MTVAHHLQKEQTMLEKHSIAAIILAAGSSSRMSNGQHKLLLPLGGRPVLAHILETALHSQASPILLILGHQSEQIEAAILDYTKNEHLIKLNNPDYQQGMSTSLRLGLAQIASLDPQHDIEGAIVLLGDQPFISTEIIDALIDSKHTSQKRIIAPCYHGKRGNPVLLDASLFGELAAVTGDEGGRSVITRHPEDIESVELGDAMANHDVDTWEAYQQAVNIWQRQHL
jgi:molybdenum cofactor cytidylyltransferase